MQVYLHTIDKNIVAYFDYDDKTIYVYMTEAGKQLHTEDEIILSIQRKLNKQFKYSSALNVFANE